MLDKAVARGVRSAVQKEISSFIHPKLAEKIGFGVGLTIAIVGYRVKAHFTDRARLARIEDKLQ